MRKFVGAWIAGWLIGIAAQAQEFHAVATLPSVAADGFYRVQLSPAVTPYLNSTFSNARIYDAQGREVPYVFQEEQPLYAHQQFREYTIVEKTQEPKCCTSLVLSNPDRRPINNISLQIRNADVSKEAILSGSDDRTNWFVIRDRFRLTASDNANGTAEVKAVNFPLSDYAYYRLQIADSTSGPLNILKAGYYDVLTYTGAYAEVPVRQMLVTDTTAKKQTYIRLMFDTLHVVDKVMLTMTNAPYFLRQATVYARHTRTTKKGDVAYYTPVTKLEVSSKQASEVYLEAVKTTELMIAVDNENNPPLTVATVKASQLNRYLIAWLKKGEAYTMKFGPDDLGMPGYDLAYFRDSIPNNPGLMAVGPITALHKPQAEDSTPTIFTNRNIVWVAIVAIIAILGFMTLRLAKDAKKDS
ncbi:DUF3999 domain-containing protein [Dawidia soli]|uniref:DUF3999 family protein n=1 Tax=Dawidia soli TaxID=2782352 RepID=A0AAP2D9E9_9BACT|nr:DUF3999 domain-containing protein [Dawidia soli]MBT1687858.1 hypothetical protein [Dawidia soli]